MDETASSLLVELAECIDRDMGRFRKRVGINVDPAPSAKGPAAVPYRRKFAMYLMSVATHSIGLQASLSPFNCSQEQMLAYIAEVFAINHEKLQDMFRGKTKDRSQLMKRHSWRPELRIRIRPPKIQGKSIISIDNIQIRVYLFKDERSPDSAAKISKTGFKNKVEKSRWLLEHIFRLRIVESSNLIRPVNEMKSLVKFKSQASQTNKNSSGVRQTSSMLGISRDVDGKIAQDEGDLYVNIRRYYCDQKTAHILRFEFWIDDEKQPGPMDRCRKAIRRYLSRGSCSKLRSKTTYMDENQEFYGYINFKLTQLASYAIKKNCTIKTLHDRSLAPCEITIEPKNRRVEDEQQEHQDARLSYNRYLINHMRLYVNLVLYQCLDIEATLCALVGQTQALPNITIDNLFYLPAHTLINQHRLQSNLNKNEDSNLRRISLWSLLINLGLLNEDSKLGVGTKIVIMSILKTDYMADRTTLDTKTMQEADPFRDWADADNGKIRVLIVQMEIEIVDKFCARILQPRLARWLSETQVSEPNYYLNRSVTLLALDLYNTALSHLSRTDNSQSVVSNVPRGVGARLREPIERLLCKLLVSYTYKRIARLSKAESSVTKDRRRIRSRRSKTERRRSLVDRQVDTDSWSRLLNDLRYIDQDLRLSWCRDGLRGLVKNQKDFVNTLKLFKRLKEDNFAKTIKTKLNLYMSGAQ